ERPEGEDFGRHSGLGLSIAGAIVVAHGGQIIVEDAPGGGAAFRVLLPAA
ncbi:ATP-binding protein, partial [Sandarakinorhabdus sp.]